MSTSALRWAAVGAAALVVVVLAGRSAFRATVAGREACTTSREFADSVASNRARLAAVDSALVAFDLAHVDSPPDTLSPAGRAGPNRLERRIIELRMEGVTAAEITRWLTQDLHLKQRIAAKSAETATAGVAGVDGAAGASADPIATIHRFESDASYVGYLRRTMQAMHDYWHDMTALPPVAARWEARCAAFRSSLPGRFAHLTYSAR